MMERSLMHELAGLILHKCLLPGSDGTCLYFQHWGSRGKWISEFEVSLVYQSKFQDNEGYTEIPCLQIQKQTNKSVLSKSNSIFNIVCIKISVSSQN